MELLFVENLNLNAKSLTSSTSAGSGRSVGPGRKLVEIKKRNSVSVETHQVQDDANEIHEEAAFYLKKHHFKTDIMSSSVYVCTVPCLVASSLPRLSRQLRLEGLPRGA